MKTVAFCVAFFCFGCAAVKEQTTPPKASPPTAPKSTTRQHRSPNPPPKQSIHKRIVSDSDTVRIAVAAIINGDFEEGLRGWRVEGPHKAKVVTAPEFPDEHCLHINITRGHACGRNVAKHPEKWLKVYQEVVVPSDAAYLTFRVRIRGAFWHEPLRIFVQKKDGRPKIVWSWGGGGSGSRMRIPWTRHVVDIHTLKGERVAIGFVGANWNGFGDHITNIWIDNVAFLDENLFYIKEPGNRNPQQIKDRVLQLLHQMESDNWLVRHKATKELAELLKSSLLALITAKQHAARLGLEGQARFERIQKDIKVVFSQIKE